MKYIKDGVIYDQVRMVVLNDMRIINPTHEEILQAGYSVYDDTPTYEQKLRMAKDKKIREIDEYDTSPAVNSFTFSGNTLWLDKATRVGLMNSTTIQKSAGATESVLWIDNIKLTLPVDAIIQMLSVLEIYALNCYNVTASHKSDVEQFTLIEDVEDYDITTDYPEKPAF